MNDQWTDRLSEYLDDELSSAEVTALEAHLGACASCRATLDELRRVVARARAFDDRPPATDLWPGIAIGIGLAPGAHPVASLGQRRARRRLSFTVPELAAAAIALAILSGGAAWLLLRGSKAVPMATTASPAPMPMLVKTRARARARAPRHRHRAGDREEPVHHRPRDSGGAERARGRPRQRLPEPAPRRADAAETGTPTEGERPRRRSELGGSGAMLATLATLTALALGAPQQTDTTLPVRSGARLEVENFGGGIGVKTWSRSAVRVTASHSSRDRIEIGASDAGLHVKAEGHRGPPHVVDYEITAPAWMALNLSGVYTDITVEGAQGEITAETVHGEVKVSGGSGNVSLK